MGEPLVKGVWFVTARRHRHVLAEPLASVWYSELLFQRALAAVQQALTGSSPR